MLSDMLAGMGGGDDEDGGGETTPFSGTESAMDEVMQSATADYVIFWQWSHDDSVLRFEHYMAIDGSLMEGSKAFKFKAEEGAVGNVWASGKPFFVADAIKLDTKVFWRQKLASYYQVRSVAMVKYPNGVLEFGSRKQWDEAPPHAGGKAKRDAEAAKFPEFQANQMKLNRVMDQTRAEYAMFWRHFSAVDELKCLVYHSVDGKLMHKSITFTYTPGVGVIGRAWVSKKRSFVMDAQALDGRKFPRKHLAKLYGIRSIAFVPFANGILELGTRETWQTAPDYSAKSEMPGGNKPRRGGGGGGGRRPPPQAHHPGGPGTQMGGGFNGIVDASSDSSSDES